MRKVEVLKTDWLFYLGENPPAKLTQWEKVRVPHDWAISRSFDCRNDLQFTKITQDGETVDAPHYGRTGGLPHVGRGTYRRSFRVNPALDCHFLEFDGVMSRSQIFINGQLAGGRPYGYASFSVDITPYVKKDADNLLEVKVNNPPLASRWYPGAGIYRQVRLVGTAQMHVKFDGVWVKPLAVDAERAEFAVELELSGEISDTEVRVSIFDPQGKAVADGHKFTLVKPQLWSIETPVQYQAKIEVLQNGKVVDQVVQRFGVRFVRFDADKGMTLNGKPFRMNGVCLHHDLGPLGAAFSVAAARRQLQLLKTINCNAIRTSHNPPAREFLDLCDEMGFVVLDEAFDAWEIGKIPNDYSSLFAQWHEIDLTDFIKRDRNHPSVIMWSIGNEINEQHEPEGWRVAVKLRDIAHRVDPTRPVTAGLDISDKAIANNLAQQLDIPGWNYKPHRYEEYHQKLPHLPQYGSETASTVSSRGQYHFPVAPGNPDHPDIHCSSYDVEFPPWASTPDKEFEFQDRCQYIMGEFVWTGFDYLGEPSPYKHHWPAHASYFGIFDLCGLAKDRVYLYKSRWSTEKVLHLLPHWNWPQYPGKNIPVHCYTNVDTVELLVNGKSQGIRHKAGGNRLVWDDVVYEPGVIVARALDADGKTIAEVSRKTAGAPVKIRMTVDRQIIGSDGDDLAFITIDALDAGGAIHPTADDRIKITVSGGGELVAVGNGDPTSLNGFASPYLSLFNGRALAIVRGKKGAADAIKVIGEAAHLAGDTINIGLQS